MDRRLQPLLSRRANSSSEKNSGAEREFGDGSKHGVTAGNFAATDDDQEQARSSEKYTKPWVRAISLGTSDKPRLDRDAAAIQSFKLYLARPGTNYCDGRRPAATLALGGGGPHAASA